MTIHSLPVATLGERRRRHHGRLRMLALFALCATPVVASYFTYYVVRPEARSNYGDLVSPPRELPKDLRLSDLAGRAVEPASLRGQWLLVVVSRPDCDEACERRLLLQRQLRETLGREKYRVDKVWLIDGVAPARSAAVEAVQQGDAATVLRVSRDALSGWLQPEAGRALDDHLYLVDPLGQWMMRMPADPVPSRLKRDLDRLLRASASWDRPGR